ncbi:hypothetical protein PENTCL1PPCAC_18294, partial [Pristionchus entomophagus]
GSGGSGGRRRFARDNQYTHHHAIVFGITFMSFALIHAARKTLSIVKGSLISAWTHNTTATQPPLFPSPEEAENFLALLDFGFLFAYAIGLYIGGVLGDRYDARVVLSIGVWLSAIVVFFFGFVTEFYRFYHALVYFALWVFGGLFQSVAWPTEICIMGNWFGRGSRGLIFGVWSGCASAGNIIGTLITSGVIYAGYQYAFAVNSILLFLFGFVIFFCLKAHPREIGLAEPWEWESEPNDVIEESSISRPIGFCRAWRLPGVIPYSFAYACLKMVTYGFFFWLPYYLHSNFGWPESDSGTLSTFFDIGGIMAAVVGGAISDRLSSRTPVVVIMLVIASFCLGVYSIVPGDFIINALMLTIVGFFVAGPANMISSSVSADLGKARELRGNTAALSTVTGIVDGTGSVGAAIGMLGIPYIQRTIGWTAVFYGFILMVICTTGCLLPTLYREWRDYRRSSLGMDPDEMEEEEAERQGLLDDQGGVNVM